VWLDRSGGAHRVDIQGGVVLDTTDLGELLAAATRTRDGFLVTTAAGEVGFVEVADRQPAAAAGQGHALD
jgi:hypothetical protein